MNTADMSDVPFGEPREDYRPGTIGQGLMDLAEWFDIYDNRCNYVGERSIQQDLRNWAVRTMGMPADEGGEIETVTFLADDTPVLTEGFCINCRTVRISKWWHCCPTHTAMYSDDVVCDTCYGILHPETKERDEIDDSGSR